MVCQWLLNLRHAVQVMWPFHFADNTRAIAELGWKPQYTLQDMLADSWNWQKQNPNGYQ